MGFDMARSSTTFRPKWQLGSTTVIRIPEKLALEVLRYAHALDANYKPDEIHDGAPAYRTAEDVETNTRELFTGEAFVLSHPKSPYRNHPA